MVSDSDEISNDWIETDRVGSLVLISASDSMWRRLVLKDVTWCLLRHEQVVNVHTSRIGHSDENTGTVRRPANAHHILVVARLEHNDRPLIKRIVKSHGTIR